MPDDTASDASRQHVFCEQDYFKRLGLLCCRCGMAIRDEFLSAFGQKYHPHHFTCSICPQALANEKYYLHAQQVFCFRHYTTASATYCQGCDLPILSATTQELWHQECFQVQSHWNIRLKRCTWITRVGDSWVDPDNHELDRAELERGMMRF
jgi:hypothetical protein